MSVHGLGLLFLSSSTRGLLVVTSLGAPSEAPWAFAIVPALKPDKTGQLCVGYRLLNKMTQNDPFLTGNLQVVLDDALSANYFSVIGLA